MNNPTLSIVATIYNDAGIVEPLIEEIIKQVNGLRVTYEIVLVNDNSEDSSEAAIESISKKYPEIVGISLTRNYGQQIAMSAGIHHSTGDFVVIMDGDLQNPPSAIPLLYEKILNGKDIVYCVSKERNGILTSLSSKLFWFILSRWFNVSIVRNQLMMKIMSRRFVEGFKLYPEINRTVDGIVNDIGMRYDVLEVRNQKRYSGRSNYNFLKRFNLMIDVVISLSTAPLNFMIYLGMFIFLLTLGLGLYYLAKFLLYDILPGFTSIMLSIFFFGGIIILMLGLIGRYLANIYTEVRHRPLYQIKKMINSKG